MKIDKSSNENLIESWQKFLGAKVDGIFGDATIRATKSFQTENGLRIDGIIGDGTLKAAIAKGFVMPVDSLAVETCLPESGVGFVNYNREDKGRDQYGTAKTIANLIALGAAWNNLSPDYPLQIGDISLRGGGRFAPHASHNKGIDADLRPMRRDKQRLPVKYTFAEYDRDLTEKFLRLVKKMFPHTTVFFNDPKLIEKGFVRTREIARTTTFTLDLIDF